MADTAELLKQKIRQKRNKLQNAGSVNAAFVNDEATPADTDLYPKTSDEDVGKSMLKDLELRRNKRKQKLKNKEDKDAENISELSELTSNLEEVKQSFMLESKKANLSESNVDEGNIYTRRSSSMVEGNNTTSGLLKRSSKSLDETATNADDHSITEADGSTSKSNAYRERIRNRMLKAKTMGQSQALEDTTSNRINRMKRASTARQLEIEKREEEDIRRKLAERRKAKEMLKASIVKSEEFLEAKPLVEQTFTVEEELDSSYDFFTKEYEEVDRPLTSETSAGETTDAENQDTTESTKLLRDYLTSGDQEEIIKSGSISYTPFRQRMVQEKLAYFVPSINSVPMDEKLPEGVENPRFAEEEGLYVGVKPSVNRFSVSKMENRIVKENASESWFGEDGILKMLPNPLEHYPCTPHDADKEIPHELVTVYKKALRNDESCSSNAGHEHYQLDINLSSCSFNHHSLFSQEHVLAKRLQTLYKQYCIIIQEDKIAYLKHKLTALRVAISNINIEDATEEGELSVKLERLKNYRNELKSAKLEKDKMENCSRKLSRNIIRVWKAIKILREAQKYTNTSIKLIIHKQNCDEQADQEHWDQEIENEVKDVEEEFEIRHQEARKKYEKELNEWKTWSIKRKEAKRKMQAIQSSPNRKDSKGENEALSREEEQVLEGEKLTKPNSPVPFNTEHVYDEVRNKAFKNRRHPGEPMIHFELKTSVSITPVHQCSRLEIQRRNDISKHKIFIKILVNNKVVCTTNPRALNPDFSIIIGQIFNVKIIHWAKEIKLQLFEVTSMIAGPNLLAEVFLPVPDLKITSRNVDLEEVEFSHNDVVRCQHEGVGSGMEFKNDCFDSPLTLLTNGFIKCGVSWAVSADGKILGPQLPDGYLERNNRSNSAALFGDSSIPELYKLVEWVKMTNLDPNDPKNASLLHLIKTVGNKDGSITAPDYFRLDHLQEEFSFCSDKDIQDNLRFQMIRLREEDSIPEFKDYRMIPLREKEIPKEIFAAYDRRKRCEEENNYLDDHKVRVSRFLSQVREQVMNRFRQVQHQKNLEDIVTEEEVPDIGTLGFNLLALTDKRRPLKPIRKDRKKVTAQNMGGADVKIVINIGRAIDMPTRTSNKDAGRFKANVPNTYHQLLRPFVEVMFQRQIVRTSVADGPNPTWNQEVQLNFKALHDNYSPTNLETVRDIIYFNVFDEVVIDLLEDNRDRDTDLHQRMEKRFLGSFNLPFSTVYFNSKVEGTFQLNVPHILLGYEKGHSHRYGGNIFESAQGAPDVTNSFLSIYVTIEPSLPPPDAFREKFESNESEKLLNYSYKWQSELDATFPKRNIKTTVIDVQGKTVFVTRFFKSIKPPNELLMGTDSFLILQRVARFVSLIPSISDSVMFPGLCDLWSTSDQFLQMLSGDEEEHAVLLCNYFLNLKKEAWVVIGNAVPEGPTAYVLTRENNDILLWNASTGTHSSVQNSYTSLQSMGCLINQDNIWANVQKNDKPSLMTFDLNRSADWKPFFHKSFPHPGLRSIQLESLNYHATDDRYVKSIEEKIENMLRENFIRWRCRLQARTRWNRHCKQILSQILPKLEECMWNTSAHMDKVFHEMSQILSSYSMTGFPIQMPYTDIETIIDAVFSTGLHLNKHDDAEFALAVYVHPYPCNVLAVWVYIASLIRI